MTDNERDETRTEETTEERLAREEIEAKRKRVSESWDKVMNTPEGRAVVFDILAVNLHAFHGTYHFHDTPEQTTAKAAVQTKGAELLAFVSTNWANLARLMNKENML